ncbi:importin-alpha export receptor [Tulasnella sp. 403]|nr:importin-alpha export receptor [Tulasnella sp. 403]
MSLPELLLASLSPATRSQAEQTLTNLSTTQPQFLTSLLGLVLESSQPLQARQAAAVYFKNAIKRRWNAEDNEELPIDPAEKTLLRSRLVPAMISLSSPSDKLLRAQVADAVGLVAAVDFPERWPDLLKVASIVTTQPATANTLLSGSTASNLETVAQAQNLLTSIYLDLTFHDIPPMFEDSVAAFFGAQGPDPDDGFFLRFLRWDPPALKGDPEDPVPTEPMRIKATILELCEMFTLKYNELLEARVPAFVRAVWELIGASGESVREDVHVAQAIKFLSVTAKTGLYTPLFSEDATLQGLAERIIVPSMPLRGLALLSMPHEQYLIVLPLTEHEIDQFEDDPLEYIRRDLSISTEGGSTRRHAASELIRALVSIGLEAKITAIVQGYISLGLQNYAQNPSGNWKSKDTAIFLLTAIASQSFTTQHGVTSTNALVDIIKFFSENVAQDLSADLPSVHPILQVDAIRFLYTFRYQLTKEQLTSVLPLLIRHLASANYVCYTYAAITIERILFMKTGKTPTFNFTDIEPYANNILTALFARMEIGGTPEKVAENEYLMKCAMRVIITSKHTLTATYPAILGRLVEILGIISKNPSNPLFNQYTFESLSALLRFVSLADSSSITQFEAALFGPFTIILQQDIDQFIPYVFQILAQMLETHSATLPEPYRALLPLLLTPPVWAQKGNIPALVRLVNAFLLKDVAKMETEGQLKTVIAIVQQRLIPSKLNDQYGFELIQTLVRTIPPSLLSTVYFGAILNALFTRLQTSKTDKFTYSMAHLVFFVICLKGEGLSADFVVSEVEKVQAGIWAQLFKGIILPEVSKTRTRDTKVIAVGLTRLLTESQYMLAPQAAEMWHNAFQALETLISSPKVVSGDVDDDDPDVALTAIDYEEQTAGYQAAFSRLAASQPAQFDAASYTKDAVAYTKQELQNALGRDPRIRSLLTSLPTSAWARSLLLGQAM